MSAPSGSRADRHPGLHVELHLDALVLHLGVDGRPDEAALRQALVRSFERAFADHQHSTQWATLGALAADAAARQVTHQVTHQAAGAVRSC